MARINPFAFSLIGGLSIFTITYILFWVLFLCLDSPNTAKEAINVLGSYFGGIATLWAAVIAAYLFNNWRDENKAVFIQKFYYDLRGEVFSLYESYLKLKTFLLDPNNRTLSNDCYDQFYKLESDFLLKADYTEQILNDLIYMLKSESHPSYSKYTSYRDGLLRAKAFFRANDPRKDYPIYHALIESNIENGKIEKGIAELKHLLSLDLIDDILNEMR
ncbi:hypothetical protein [Acinetobacter towneri]|uniref:hypothetical protein n=1 Tax=Acinetobacter towneri TaxID=202956 RepID=UPI0034D695BE